MTMPNYSTLFEIERIANLTDPVLRNLQITQAYHELAQVMAQRTGPCANWCTFATWASKQAGQTIRKEDLGRALESTLGSRVVVQQAVERLALIVRRRGAEVGLDECSQLVWKAFDPQAAFARSSDAVARGNLKVFAEIGREFARFYADCFHDPVFDADHIACFCDALRPGDPPEGQRYLRGAFLHYYRALFEDDEKTRLELLLFANLQIGLHEQTRLQPEINQALAAPLVPPQTFAQNLLRLLLPHRDWRNPVVWFFLRLLGRLSTFDAAAAVILEEAQREAQFIATQTLMSIELPPHQRLRLGDDLPLAFPTILQPIANHELQALLAQIDPTPDSTRESGAAYWGNLPDRLHFIADMFRCYQTSADLFAPPFDPEQTAALKQNRLPAGRL